MKFYKSFSILFICLIMLVSSLGFSVMADSDITVTVGSAEGIVGSIISIPVTVSEGSGMVSGAFCIEYNENYLDFVGYTEGNISQLTQLYVDKVAVGENAVGLIFSTENSDIAVEDAGTIVNLNFRVTDTSTEAQKLTVNLVRPDDLLVEGGIADANGMISANYINGAIDISEATVALAYAVSYNEEAFDEIISVSGGVGNAFAGQLYSFDRSNSSVYVKYILSGVEASKENVVVNNESGSWTFPVDGNGVAQIPMYLITDMTTITYNSYIEGFLYKSFTITESNSSGSQSFVSDYINAEISSDVLAKGTSFTTDNYNVDVYYTLDESDNFTKTKVWVAKSIDSYSYNFNSLELTADHIEGKATTSDVTFNVSPASAVVTFDNRSITAINGVAVFEDVPFGVADYTVSLQGFTTVSGSVNVVQFTPAVNISLSRNSTTEVTFVVTPDNATIEFNGEIIEAFEGYATFEDVAFGEKEYTVSAE
ncbi:MAG: hypothetical protein IJC89_04680, partial [Clostridia bacterium]|nr:hypothetical protein [Clostridia bacterium]